MAVRTTLSQQLFLEGGHFFLGLENPVRLCALFSSGEQTLQVVPLLGALIGCQSLGLFRNKRLFLSAFFPPKLFGLTSVSADQELVWPCCSDSSESSACEP